MVQVSYKKTTRVSSLKNPAWLEKNGSKFAEKILCKK
jgi:hypothetical protein